MRQSLAKKLCCPFDKQELELKVFVQDTEQNIIEGIFTCTHCKRYYPIVYGIPIMTPDEYRELQLEAPVLERWQNKLSGNFAAGLRLLESSSENPAT